MGAKQINSNSLLTFFKVKFRRMNLNFSFLRNIKKKYYVDWLDTIDVFCALLFTSIGQHSTLANYSLKTWKCNYYIAVSLSVALAQSHRDLIDIRHLNPMIEW